MSWEVLLSWTSQSERSREGGTGAEEAALEAEEFVAGGDKVHSRAQPLRVTRRAERRI